jgi:hypothetical protein
MATGGSFISSIFCLPITTSTRFIIANSILIRSTNRFEMACYLRNSNFSSEVYLWRIFHVQRHCIADIGCICYLHARDSRSIA